MPTTRLVGESVPMLINGVSQQSEINRLPTQVAEQINCTSSMVQGLSKRPPTEFLKQLATNKDWTNAKIHMISRDEHERYIVVLQGGTIQVFDLDGNEHSVDAGSLLSNQDYITLASDDTYNTPVSAFRLHTVADTTFIVNRNTVVKMDSNSASPSNKPYRAMVWIKSSKQKKLHRITIKVPDDGSGNHVNISVSYRPKGDDVTNLNHSAQMLVRELKTVLASTIMKKDIATSTPLTKTWKVGHYTNIIYIESSIDDFSVSASNDWSDTYVSVIKDLVGGVAELPSRGFPGMKVQIGGSVEENDGGFWVEFKANNEELEQLDDDGFSVATFASGDVDAGDDEIFIDDHSFLSRTLTGTDTAISDESGGERELVQYQEGSFEIGGLTDNEFYFVEPRFNANGTLTNKIRLSAFPSKDITNEDNTEEAGDEIGLSTPTGNFDPAPERNLSSTPGDHILVGVIATLKTTENHYWSVGDTVRVASMAPEEYNGSFVLTAVTDDTISYAVEGEPSAVTDSTNGEVSGTVSTYESPKLIRVRLMHGKWIESVAPSTDSTPLLTEFDSKTMPHLLVRSAEVDAEDRFKFYLLRGQQNSAFPLHKWGARSVGDKISSPDPSFVDSTINDVFEWRQSLGFASNQNFILSERAQYFNFWAITVVTSLDSSRIDVAASGSNMSNFHSIRVCQDLLVGFTNEGQFTLSSSGATLTPSTVNLSQSTKYESSETGQPVNIGSSLAFPTSRGNFSAISEFFVREDQMAYVNENTRHVPHYIEGNVINMSVSPVSDSMIVQSDKDAKVLYFYQWYWQGENKVQSSWSKWTFGSNVIGAAFFKDVLYLIMQASVGTSNPELYKLILTAGDLDEEDTVTEGVGGIYKTSLDRRVVFNNHSSATLTLDYTIESGTMRVVESNGRVLTIASQDGDTITLSEPVDPPTDVYVGEIYDSQVEFTRPIMRSQNKETVDLRSRLQIQDYVLYHEDTGYFKAKVYPKSYSEDPYEYEMDNVLGGTTVGTPPVYSDSFTVPIRANAREMKLVIHNDSHLPHHLVSSEWSARYSPRLYKK